MNNSCRDVAFPNMLSIVVNCSKCGFEGRLAHCEGCSRYFHKKCTVPHLKKIHKHWMCTDCVPKESSPKSSKRKFISDAVESPEPKQRRCSASAAVVNISKYAKQLQRSDSWNGSRNMDNECKKDKESEGHGNEVCEEHVSCHEERQD
uniref:PHD-type domain-containing protein n=1 Tax=Timema cristinae TaxID=61476 RepID=A0A7R9H503_TIMCR|nr:unnamed protein product [Timema cristinae]